jgi:hypothetical protein
MRVMVPVSSPHDSIEIPANRSVKPLRILAAVSADGLHLKPMIIVQRKTHEVDPFAATFTPVKVLAVHRKRNFTGRNLFRPCVEQMLFPGIERQRVE